jgi:hypothetical protein
MLMLPSCREISQLASDNLDTPIKGSRWLKMKLHLMMCNYCRLYQKHMDLTQKTIGEMDNHNHKECEHSKSKVFEQVEASYKKSHSNK